MQFVAEDPVHVVIRNEAPALHDTTGRMVQPGRRRVFAKFKRGTAPVYVRDIAEDLFEFRKMPDGIEAGQWVSFYDSVEDQAQMGWTDEEREAIEAKLENHHAAVKIEKPRLAAPWPKYDEVVAVKGGLTSKQVVERILARAEEDGYDPAAIIAYELENRARKSVVDALTPLAGSPEPDPGIEVEEEELVEA